MKPVFSTILLLACGAASGWAQQRNPVQWTLDLSPTEAPPGSSIAARFSARMEPGWHIYALTSPAGGPTPTTIKLNAIPAIGEVKLYQPKPKTKFDPNFSMNVDAFEGDLTLAAEIRISPDAPAGPVELPFLVRYQACTDKECLPRRVTLTGTLTVSPAAPAAKAAIPAGYEEFTGQRPAAASSAAPPATSASEGGFAWFLAVAFGFGLAAIFTPCVFPMIPITLSFFLNRPGITRAQSLKQALFFCLGIVVLFTAIGLSVAAIVGPFGVVQLGSNPWVNAFIALVFLVFGLSLLGAYEFTLPSGLLTKLNSASERGGMAGTLLMGLTFCLTSFACVGPFVGTLLAGSVQRGGMEPALGMMMFATGLASPFFLLALFPSYLQRLPRSGGWMTRVKVVLGFVILAVMFKYLSSID
jgi:thiol:disulfide interchange protein DsbD